ncbi:DUF4907 domain-containing protein [Cellulophaga tyrosinoxydans]|uniref:DUF4907 domain-containing protein n=1 Tax=Cellulophaga tyrosinoxydans TaxID=504486 RepID=A0A1W1ZTU2_9FLAO|nr:DUF4907 domain-containing protein [Cellulophaga tyrosinoxydans]SMC51879.1 protein of unknown function [Cellulophaga tyrosinoxydans]
MKIDKRNKTILLGALIIDFIVLVVLLFQALTIQKPLYSEVFNVGNGYGYYIKTYDKTLIKQNFIPAIQGEKSFVTKKDAQKVANLVMEKITENESPVVTVNELNNLNIRM